MVARGPCSASSTSGAFFPLIFLAGYHLPGGLAATLTASAPIVVMLTAWALIAERPAVASVIGAVDRRGRRRRCSCCAVGCRPTRSGWLRRSGRSPCPASGYVLAKRWRPPVGMLTFAAWQLVAGGLVLVPVAALVEGAPPALDARAVGGYLYICVFGTALAFVAWFTGLRRMPAGAVSLVGLLNPVTGVLLGVALAGEAFGAAQAIGMVLVLGGVLLGQPAVRGLVDRADGPANPVRPLVLDGAGAAADQRGRSVPAA